MKTLKIQCLNCPNTVIYQHSTIYIYMSKASAYAWFQQKCLLRHTVVLSNGAESGKG